ncbi:hypothetical protein ACQKGL_18610 [Ensifer adhaerens]|uniref:hypothetical protein n=1 Tax=Ensifer adhaerens TaxID=106592 RepID=UPI003CFF4DD7
MSGPNQGLQRLGVRSPADIPALFSWSKLALEPSAILPTRQSAYVPIYGRVTVTYFRFEDDPLMVVGVMAGCKHWRAWLQSDERQKCEKERGRFRISPERND